MIRTYGAVLRLVGPLIEIVCLMALMRMGGENPTYLGVPLRSILLSGIGIGLVCVIAGLVMSQQRPRRD